MRPPFEPELNRLPPGIVEFRAFCACDLTKMPVPVPHVGIEPGPQLLAGRLATEGDLGSTEATESRKYLHGQRLDPFRLVVNRGREDSYKRTSLHFFLNANWGRMRLKKIDCGVRIVRLEKMQKNSHPPLMGQFMGAFGELRSPRALALATYSAWTATGRF